MGKGFCSIGGNSGVVFLMLGKMRQGNFFLKRIFTLKLFSGGVRWGANPVPIFLRRLRGRIQPKLIAVICLYQKRFLVSVRESFIII